MFMQDGTLMCVKMNFPEVVFYMVCVEILATQQLHPLTRWDGLMCKGRMRMVKCWAGVLSGCELRPVRCAARLCEAAIDEI